MGIQSAPPDQQGARGTPGDARVSPELRTPGSAAADVVLGAPEGSVLALGGIDGQSLRLALNAVEPERHLRRALLARVVPRPTPAAIVEQVIDLLAKTAHRCWPIWFTDVSFAGCGNDRLGKLGASAIARKAAEEIPGVLPAWADAAARLALSGRAPRVSGTLPAIELGQLALAVNRSGIVLVADMSLAAQKAANPAAVVHALEWIARNSRTAVIALFAELPPNEPPFDRILYGAHRVIVASDADKSVAGEAADEEPWLAPWQGEPHPLSDVERRLARALRADAELAPLFSFNQFVDTMRGSRPKVDLLWAEGRLVVELDGFASHGNRAAFMYDRHRDYELTLSGYTVLRLANDEVVQDMEKAVEKIRDLVKLCRTRIASEG